MVKTSKTLYYTPRILACVFLVFLASFSLDVFDSASGFWNILLGLLIHNIPVIILTLCLILAWKKEIIGTIIFTLAGLTYITWIIVDAILHSFERYVISYSFIIAGPCFLIAYLFWKNWKNKHA